VFSENTEIYQCNMEKAMSRLMQVAELHQMRVDAFTEGPDNCRTVYSAASSELNNYKGLTDDDGNLPSDYVDLFGIVNDMKRQNDLAQIYSCALVY